jgi:hypothetical protein
MARYVQRHGLMVDGKLMPGSEVAKTPGFINAARGFDREGMLAQARRQGQDPRQRAALAPENLAYSSVMREMEEDARYDAPSLGPGLGMYNQRGAGGTPYREVGSVQAADAALMGDGSVRTRAAPGLRPGLSRPDSAPRGPGALARPAGKVDDDREAQKRISRLPKDQQPKAWNDYQDLKLRKEQAAAEAQSRKDALAESKAAREQANENARLDRAQRTTLGVREFQSKDYATESQERVGMEQARATAQRYQQSLAASSARLAQSASYKAAAQRYKGEASAYAAKIQRVLPAADWSGEKIPDYTPVLTLIAARGYGPAFLKQLDAIQAQNAPAATREALILDLLTKAGV